MEKTQDDKFWYLSGEAKRKIVEYDLNKQFQKLHAETDEKFNNLKGELIRDEATIIVDALKESLGNSVKPNIKVPNKRKKVNCSKKLIAAGACTLFIAAGITTPKIVEISKINSMVNEKVMDFNEEYVVPSTHYNTVLDEVDNGIKVIHWHDYMDIFMNAKNSHEDPVVSFYLAYSSLGDYCMNQGIDIYNHLYGTDYTDVNDFLQKNNFSSTIDLKKYVANVFESDKEASLDGSSNLGR